MPYRFLYCCDGKRLYPACQKSVRRLCYQLVTSGHNSDAIVVVVTHSSWTKPKSNVSVDVSIVRLQWSMPKPAVNFNSRMFVVCETEDSLFVTGGPDLCDPKIQKIKIGVVCQQIFLRYTSLLMFSIFF